MRQKQKWLAGLLAAALCLTLNVKGYAVGLDDAWDYYDDSYYDYSDYDYYDYGYDLYDDTDEGIAVAADTIDSYEVVIPATLEITPSETESTDSASMEITGKLRKYSTLTIDVAHEKNLEVEGGSAKIPYTLELEGDGQQESLEESKITYDTLGNSLDNFSATLTATVDKKDVPSISGEYTDTLTFTMTYTRKYTVTVKYESMDSYKNVSSGTHGERRSVEDASRTQTYVVEPGKTFTYTNEEYTNDTGPWVDKEIAVTTKAGTYDYEVMFRRRMCAIDLNVAVYHEDTGIFEKVDNIYIDEANKVKWGSVNFYVNGKLRNRLSDYYTALPYGTEYEFRETEIEHLPQYSVLGYCKNIGVDKMTLTEVNVSSVGILNGELNYSNSNHTTNGYGGYPERENDKDKVTDGITVWIVLKEPATTTSDAILDDTTVIVPGNGDDTEITTPADDDARLDYTPADDTTDDAADTSKDPDSTTPSDDTFDDVMDDVTDDVDTDDATETPDGEPDSEDTEEADESTDEVGNLILVYPVDGMLFDAGFGVDADM